MIRSFFVPFVHSLHIEISLNLSVFLAQFENLGELVKNTIFVA